MARQFDFQKLTVIRALRTVSTSSGSGAGNSVWPTGGPGRPAISASAPPRAKDGLVVGLLNRLRSDNRVVSLLQFGDDILGFGDVKRAQNRVSEIEKEFMDVRKIVKTSAKELHNVQTELRTIRAKLDRTPRDDVKFLEYATEEHLAIQKEKKMEENHDSLEDVERSTFGKLSAAVRESHEKQRLQEQRTKYWVIILPIVGIIGLLGKIAIKRMREPRTMVEDLQKDIGQNGQLRDLQGFVHDIQTAIDVSAKLGHEVSATLEKLTQQQQDRLDSKEKNITQILKQQEGTLLKEMEGVRRFAAVGAGDMTTLEEMVQNAEQKLEWVIKMSALSTVVYGAFILYSIFK